MLPQFTVYAKILCLLMVVMGALSTTLDTTLISGCSGKAVQMDSAGRVFASDQHQKVTLTSHIVTSKHGNITTHITLFVKEQKKYICFSKKWKLVALKSNKNKKRCFFQETLKNGNFQYQSIIDGNKFIGFRKNGKPIHYDVEPKNLDANCLSFLKLENMNQAHSAMSPSEMVDDARVDSGTSHSKTANKRKQFRRPEPHRVRANQIKHISQKENTGRFEKEVRYSAQETTSSIPPDSVLNVRSLEHRGRETIERKHRHRKGQLHRHNKHHSHSEPEKTHFSLEQYSGDDVRSLRNDAHRHSGSKHNHRKV